MANALVLPACGTNDENKELQRCQGTWKWESVVFDGDEAPAEAFRDWRIVKQGNTYTLTQGNTVARGTFKVDASKSPKTIDITRMAGPKKDTISKGIYELDGDMFEVSIDPEGRSRPTAFESRRGSGYLLYVLRREKP
jgi:uncharacterized protein (TIGR03067 family)